MSAAVVWCRPRQQVSAPTHRLRRYAKEHSRGHRLVPVRRGWESSFWASAESAATASGAAEDGALSLKRACVREALAVGSCWVTKELNTNTAATPATAMPPIRPSPAAPSSLPLASELSSDRSIGTEKSPVSSDDVPEKPRSVPFRGCVGGCGVPVSEITVIIRGCRRPGAA